MAANALRKLWHRRWGHPYTQNLKSICSSESINVIFHSTALSSYFDDEPDPNVRVPLVAPPPSPSPNPDLLGVRLWYSKVVVEQKITRKRNLTRHDIDRENFVAECFTMDEKRSKAVAEAFVRLSNKGLVYRQKTQSPSWEFSIHPFNGRKLPIVCDEKLVDMNFGTGAVKINLDIKRVVENHQWCDKLWNATPPTKIIPCEMPFSCQWIVSTLNKAIGRTVSSLESYDLFNAASESWNNQNVEDEMDKVLPIVKGLRSKRVSGGRICKNHSLMFVFRKLEFANSAFILLIDIYDCKRINVREAFVLCRANDTAEVIKCRYIKISTLATLSSLKVSSDSDASPTEWLTEVVEVGDESVIISL
ncbi:hypothetical protein CQW23_21587 [Capsicum baccatum]|uniref:valine--tRNA ligase n=1 Tax=Capsicum baccatum TaxID=33114 RepID=A0A2G2VYE8_CAPBA|nr:hypothetical protein CQW23_21587 [Capsicum baccatum]